MKYRLISYFPKFKFNKLNLVQIIVFSFKYLSNMNKMRKITIFSSEISKFQKILLIKVLADTYIYGILKFHSSKTFFVGATALLVLPMPKSAWKSSNFD